MDLSRGPVTTGVTLGGRTVLSRVFHVDLHRMVERVSRAATENVGANSHVVARAALRWVTLFVRNFEMTIYWGITWAAAHLLIVVLGAEVLGAGHVPQLVVLAAKMLPGGMFAISIARLVITMARVRQVDVFAGARADLALTSGGPPRGWLLVRLLQPTDIDVALVLTVTVVAGFLTTR